MSVSACIALLLRVRPCPDLTCHALTCRMRGGETWEQTKARWKMPKPRATSHLARHPWSSTQPTTAPSWHGAKEVVAWLGSPPIHTRSRQPDFHALAMLADVATGDLLI